MKDICPREEAVILSDVGRFLPTPGPAPPPWRRG